MTRPIIESATLFTPGRASYLDEAGVLQLTDASSHRAHVAASFYDADFHDVALYAGGFPGLAQGWDNTLIPPANRREAHLMAVPLELILEDEGKSPEEIEKIVLKQGDSDNSFGDVILSVERGLLDPNKFNNNSHYGINLTTGALHGRRFRSILSKALDINPARIRRIAMGDVYGTPEYPQRPAERRSVALAKELAAIAATEFVLRNVKPGDVEALKDAEEHFMAIASKRS